MKTEAQEEKLLRIRLLGPPEASLEGVLLRFEIKKTLAHLCYLATEGGRHPRREFAKPLWPESEERRARADLRAVLYKLRKNLGQDSAHDRVARFIVIESGRLGLQLWGIDLDLEAFEADVSLASSETSLGGISAAGGRRELIGRLQGDLELYRGEFMEGFSLEDVPESELWLEAERARWRRVFGELCESLSHLEGEEGLREAAYRYRPAVGEAGPFRGGRPAAAGRAPVRRGRQREGSAGLRGLPEYPRQNAWEGAFFSDARACPSFRGGGRGEGFLGASLIPSAATLTITTQLSVFEVPLVGRHEEFGVLVSEYHDAREEGESRVVAVLGEAGIGHNLPQEAPQAFTEAVFEVDGY